jgi:hypothetical protein
LTKHTISGGVIAYLLQNIMPWGNTQVTVWTTTLERALAFLAPSTCPSTTFLWGAIYRSHLHHLGLYKDSTHSSRTTHSFTHTMILSNTFLNDRGVEPHCHRAGTPHATVAFIRSPSTNHIKNPQIRFFRCKILVLVIGEGLLENYYFLHSFDVHKHVMHLLTRFHLCILLGCFRF